MWGLYIAYVRLYKAYKDILGKVSFDAKDISEDEDEVEVEEEVAAEGEDTVEVEVEEVEFEEV